MRKAAIYIRISVDREQETSTSTQQERCREYAERHGWNVVGVYEDKGKSAYSGGRRPQLEKLLGDIDSGVVDTVVVWKLDRWCRSLQEFVRLRDRLEKAGCHWVSVTDNFDTSTAMGKAMLGVVVVFAELESAIKSERINEWHRKRTASGSPPAGPPPFGYDEEWKPIPQEAELIRKAATGVLDGTVSIHGTVRAWNEAGIKTRGIGTPGNWYSEPGPWSRRGFTKLLRSPTLAGMRVVDGVAIEGEWEPILDRQTHHKLTALFDDPTRRNNIGAKRKLLSGILHCGECGSRMGHRGHKAGPRYTCRSAGEDLTACGRISIQADIADEYIRQVVAAAVADGLPKLEMFDPLEVERLESELSELAGDYGRGAISRAEWLAARSGLERRLSEAVEAAERSSQSVPTNLVEAWEGMSIEQRRGVVLSLIERAEVSRGYSKSDRIKVVWRA